MKAALFVLAALLALAAANSAEDVKQQYAEGFKAGFRAAQEMMAKEMKAPEPEAFNFLPTPQTQPKCCSACAAPLVKMYSIDRIFNTCGESCMDPAKYWLFKIFEPGLVKAGADNTPCATKGYTSYQLTESHGFGSVTATIDMYKKP
eukprot:Colp12_sorted_trinity150504_noHs@5907